jgi:hypothetical protein
VDSFLTQEKSQLHAPIVPTSRPLVL